VANCTNCGALAPANASFCPACGHALASGKEPEAMSGAAYAPKPATPKAFPLRTNSAHYWAGRVSIIPVWAALAYNALGRHSSVEDYEATSRLLSGHWDIKVAAPILCTLYLVIMWNSLHTSRAANIINIIVAGFFLAVALTSNFSGLVIAIIGVWAAVGLAGVIETYTG
jgi:zinc-ribbon domain